MREAKGAAFGEKVDVRPKMNEAKTRRALVCSTSTARIVRDDVLTTSRPNGKRRRSTQISTPTYKRERDGRR